MHATLASIRDPKLDCIALKLFDSEAKIKKLILPRMTWTLIYRAFLSVLRVSAVVWCERQSCLWDPADQRIPVCHRKERGDGGVPSEWWCGGVTHGGPLLCPAQHRGRRLRPCGGVCVCVCEPVSVCELLSLVLMMIVISLAIAGVRSECSIKSRRHPGYWRCCVYL